MANLSYWFLKKFNLFKAMPEKELMALSDRMPYHSVSKGQILDAEEKDAIYFLKEGSAQLLALTPEGEEFTLDILGPGEIFGPAISGYSTPYHTYLRVSEKSIVCSMDKAGFLKMLEEKPSMAFQIIRLYEEKNQLLKERLVNQLFKPIEQRLVDEILRIHARNPVSCSHGGEGEVVIHQQELADLIGASRQAVNVILKGLAQTGAIRIRSGTICLIELGQLTGK